MRPEVVRREPPRRLRSPDSPHAAFDNETSDHLLSVVERWGGDGGGGGKIKGGSGLGVNSSPAFAGEGDQAKPGGGALLSPKNPSTALRAVPLPGKCRGGILVGRPVQPGRALREDLAAILGDADAVLELRGQRAVAGDGGPAVLEQLHAGLADVDHRLDREEHARPQLRAGAGAAGMDHLRSVVEDAADA